MPAVDREQSLFCSKIRAGRTAMPRGRYSSGERQSREPRVRLLSRGSGLEFLAAPLAGI